LELAVVLFSLAVLSPGLGPLEEEPGLTLGKILPGPSRGFHGGKEEQRKDSPEKSKSFLRLRNPRREWETELLTFAKKKILRELFSSR
jgi:hypothetical protein